MNSVPLLHSFRDELRPQVVTNFVYSPTFVNNSQYFVINIPPANPTEDPNKNEDRLTTVVLISTSAQFVSQLFKALLDSNVSDYVSLKVVWILISFIFLAGSLYGLPAQARKVMKQRQKRLKTFFNVLILVAILATSAWSIMAICAAWPF